VTAVPVIVRTHATVPVIERLHAPVPVLAMITMLTTWAAARRARE
jgi:hypothetical protein